ncbi:MAG: hypothetical protein LC689_21585 [Myxococcales bacterium]|nr:hypothetical protein [Myxococcales bacterium]
MGRGGMSSVRRVHDKNLDRRVAMKVLNPELAVRDVRMVEAFLEEAQIRAQLDHPNVVRIHEMGCRSCSRCATRCRSPTARACCAAI